MFGAGLDHLLAHILLQSESRWKTAYCGDIDRWQQMKMYSPALQAEVTSGVLFVACDDAWIYFHAQFTGDAKDSALKRQHLFGSRTVAFGKTDDRYAVVQIFADNLQCFVIG